MTSLHDVLAAEGGLIAAALGGQPPEYSSSEGSDPSGRDPSGGDPSGGEPPGGEPLAYAAVREGQRLHAGEPRVVTGAEPDLALLAGDRLYALGLDRLAEAGDLPAIAALAELISACAQAQADGDPQAAQAAWEQLDRRADS